MNLGTMWLANGGGSGWFAEFARTFEKCFIREDRYKLLLEGIGVTIKISLLAALLGLVIDSATAQKYVGDNEGLKIVEDAEAFSSEEYGIAVNKENTELLEQLNDILTKMKNDGTINELSAKYSEQ